ncbi:MAG TPA: redox-regulated ATPase YchF [Candidatus Acidoferrales bacterium]|nr:redox-regulated ATPase YchF [Candidatus Acidoferrales bacterium]
MRTGIIGLPGVGKTSLFRILTRAHLDAKAARDAIHVGVARVPDARLEPLAALYKPKKITHATIEYVDVAGLARDKARDSALLVEMRQVDALVTVVRLFEDAANPHPSGSLNALRDLDSVEVELMLHDLEQVLRRLERLEKDLKKKREAHLEREQAVLFRCKAALEAENPLRALELTAEEAKLITGYMFLSRKPMLCAVNLGDDEAAQISSAVERHGLAAIAAKPQVAVVPFCGRIEAELAEMEEAEAAELMSSYGLAEAGRDRLIAATYSLLGLMSFLTAGEPEVRAWMIRRGATALEAAGAIHTDIAHGFIKAEVVSFEHLIAAGSLAGARERGQVRLEGKEYVVQDGDVILFRHSG